MVPLDSLGDYIFISKKYIKLYILFFFHRMRVKKLPKILALHLKRFKYMEQLNRFTKLSHRVLFTFELRLFETVSLIVICLKIVQAW